MQKESGFTLVELMIVIAIASALMLVATFSYLSLRPSLRLSGATRQMLGDLMRARMKSVNQKKSAVSSHDTAVTASSAKDSSAPSRFPWISKTSWSWQT